MSYFNEYDFDKIDQQFELAYNVDILNHLDMTKDEKNLIKGIIYMIYCPQFQKNVYYTFGFDFTPNQLLKLIFKSIKINYKKNPLQNLLSLPWKSKLDTKYKQHCGSCYGTLIHPCTLNNCDACKDTGILTTICKHCVKLPHTCNNLCKNGYMPNRKVCPEIIKLSQSKNCRYCKGNPNNFKRKCKGACPLLQYSTLSNNKLDIGCACYKPHRIGDCHTKWQYSDGYVGKSPYQRIEKCNTCNYIHFKILNFKNIHKCKPI